MTKNTGPAALNRTFAFEEEFVAHLRCIPMAVRRKLDLCGLKVKLAHWNKLPDDSRQQMLRHEAGEAHELLAFRQTLMSQIEKHAGTVPGDLPVPEPVPWHAPLPPAELVEVAAGHGVHLDATRWRGLDELQRFALVKLGRPSHESDNFVNALREFGLLSSV